VTQPFGVRAQWLWLLRFLECHIKGAMAGRCIYRGSRLTAALWSRNRMAAAKSNGSKTLIEPT
jgi:hypothetical protein